MISIVFNVSWFHQVLSSVLWCYRLKFCVKSYSMVGMIACKGWYRLEIGVNRIEMGVNRIEMGVNRIEIGVNRIDRGQVGLKERPTKR